MNFSMKGQEKDDLLIQVITWAGFTVCIYIYIYIYIHNVYIYIYIYIHTKCIYTGS